MTVSNEDQARSPAPGSHPTNYSTIICGGGPAGTGPLVHAVQEGRFDELLDTGVLLIDKGNRIGPGALASYGIRANSLGVAFLECLDRSSSRGIFDHVRVLPEALLLAEAKGTTPSLRIVADYLAHIGVALKKALDANPRCHVALGTEVMRIQVGAHDRVEVMVKQRSDGVSESERSYTSQRVVLALGGAGVVLDNSRELVPGLHLEQYMDKTVHSSELIDVSHGLTAGSVKRLRANPRVVILGGSHSAWSAAWMLLNSTGIIEKIRFPTASIALLHRSPIRLYYPNSEMALADGYSFDPVADVCPLSGRVNRFGGLRGDALEMARQVLGLVPGHTEPRIQTYQLQGSDALSHDSLRRLFDDAGLIVAAFGYRANVPTIYGPDGCLIDILHTGTGLAVDASGRVMTRDRKLLSNVFAYGLGAGMAVSPEVGGEPSYRGRTDGVWIYQNDVGRIILRELLPPIRELCALTPHNESS